MNLGFSGLPQPCLGQSLLGVAPHRHRIGIAQGHPLDLRRGQVLEARQGETGLLRRDEHQGVAHKIFPAGRHDESLLLGLVHGLLVRRGEHVHRGALGDLLEQGAGRGKIKDNFAPRMLFFKELADFRQGVGEAGGGGNDQFLVGRGRRPPKSHGARRQQEDHF